MTYRLAPDASIMVVDGAATIRMGEMRLRAPMSSSAVRTLFELGQGGFATPEEAARRLSEAGEPPAVAQRIVAELLDAGVLVEADDLRWARAFHRQSSHGCCAARGGERRSINGPPHPASTVSRLAVPFDRLLGLRRSAREFGGDHLTPDDLEVVLWAGFGMTTGNHRTVPSAGGLGGVRPIVAVTRVSGLEPGIYAMTPGALERYATLPSRLADLFATGHVDYDRCASVVFMAVGLSRLGEAYSELGYRFGLLEAGHCAQNMLLAAAALRCAAVPIGALDDDVAHSMIGLGHEELLVYAVVLGTHA
jgi:SagB-type dehydrogenase family enzyme